MKSFPQPYHLEYLFYGSCQHMLNTLVIVSMEGLYVMTVNKSFKRLMMRVHPQLQELSSTLLHVFEVEQCITNRCIVNHMNAVAEKYKLLVKQAFLETQRTDCLSNGVNLWIEGMRQLGFDATFIRRKDSLNGIVIREEINEALNVSDFVKDRIHPSGRLEKTRYFKGKTFNETSQNIWCNPQYFYHENRPFNPIDLMTSIEDQFPDKNASETVGKSIENSKYQNINMELMFNPIVGRIFQPEENPNLFML